jgi:hypothetical protein
MKKTTLALATILTFAGMKAYSQSDNTQNRNPTSENNVTVVELSADAGDTTLSVEKFIKLMKDNQLVHVQPSLVDSTIEYMNTYYVNLTSSPESRKNIVDNILVLGYKKNFIYAERGKFIKINEADEDSVTITNTTTIDKLFSMSDSTYNWEITALVSENATGKPDKTTNKAITQRAYWREKMYNSLKEIFDKYGKESN